MSVFRYESPDTPATGSIAALMLRRGDIAAQQAQTVAAAQARAQEVSGQAWAGAAQNIAHSVAGTVDQLTDPQRQLESLKLKEQRTGIAEHDTFKTILKNTPPVNENGMQLYDLPTLASKATAAGIDPSGFLDHYANVNNGFRNEYQARMSTVQAGAQGLMLAPDPVLAKDFLDRLKANNTITAQVYQHLSDVIDADPTPANITRIVTPFAGPQKPVMGKYGETPLNAITGRPMAPSLPDKPVVVPKGGSLVQTLPASASGQPTSPNAPSRPTATTLFSVPPDPTPAGNEAAIRALYAKRESGATLAPEEHAAIKGYEAEKSSNDAPVTVKTMVNGRPVERVMTRAQALAAGEFPSQPAASVIVNNQVDAALKNLPSWTLDDSRPSGADANRVDPTIGRTPNALYQDALAYIQEGKYPQLGRGAGPTATAMRAAIENKAGAITASAGMDMPQLRAFFRSNESSLKGMQKTADAAAANIATADRNSALLEDALKKMPDSGSPLLNQPLRSFSKNVLGNAEMAPIATYLASVQNEYGKLISSSSGNNNMVLSDSARHEAQALIDPNATVAQMLGSMRALNREGTNRLLSTGDQIKAIQGRMKLGNAPDTTPKADPLGLFKK